MLRVDGDDSLVSREVWATGIFFGSHPHTLTLGGDRLGSHKVSQEDVTIEGALIDILGRSVEASATLHDALPLLALTFLPSINLVLANH